MESIRGTCEGGSKVPESF